MVSVLEAVALVVEKEKRFFIVYYVIKMDF